MEMNGTVIKKFSTKPDKKAKEGEMKVKPGFNRHIWNMRYADAESFDGIILWAGSLTGPKAIPGKYKAKLTINLPTGQAGQPAGQAGGQSQEVEFEIVKDPRSTGIHEDIKAQFDFLIQVRDKLSETNKAVKRIRYAREQINRVTEPMKGKEDMKDVTALAKTILDDMKKIEETLYQTKNRSNQDPLNFPIRLNNKLAGLAGEAGGGDFRPTEQVKAVYKELSGKIDEQLATLNKIINEQVPKLNALVKEKKVDAVVIGD
jgi:hypothetical protein